MKKKVINILLIIMFFAGLSLLLYPTISDYYNSYLQSKIILEYAEQVDEMEEEVCQQMTEAAQTYNAALLERANPFALTDEWKEVYWSMLSTDEKGIMAYVEIPTIGVKLPIAHGTAKDVLENCVGHMEWSSLPVGGESTHCVISGHRGLPSAELFTNIDHLEIGDVFYIHVLGRKLTYRVDNVAVVDPYDYSLLHIEEGKDYVTLLTCTPYGINSHRLLVRGIRVDEAEQQENGSGTLVSNEVSGLDIMVLAPVALCVVAAVLFVFILLDHIKRTKRKEKDHEKK